MLECTDLTASAADAAATMASHAGAWAAAASAKAWEVSAVASAGVSSMTASVVPTLEKVDWKRGREHLRSHQLQLIISGLSVAASLSAIYYVRASQRRPALEDSKGGDDGAPPPVASPSATSVLGREIEFHPDAAEPPSAESPALHTPVAKSRRDVNSAGDAPTATTNDSPDTSFDTETSADVSVLGDLTVSTTDPESAKVRVKELTRRAKSFARRKKFVEAADAYTEALELLETVDPSNKIACLIVSLLTSRSLMYEQAGQTDLAIEDCQAALRRGKVASPVLSQPRVQKRMLQLQQQLLAANGTSPTPSPKKRSPLRLSFLKKVGFSPNRPGRSPSKSATPS